MSWSTHLLIGTVKHFMEYMRKDLPTDKNLPYILERVCHVHGDNKTFNAYKEKVEEYLNLRNDSDIYTNMTNMTNAQARSCELFLNGRSEFLKNGKYTTTTSDQNKFTLSKLNYNHFNVKNIHRLLTLNIYKLGSIFKLNMVEKIDSEVIDLLKSMEIINDDTATNLKKALNFIVYLRNKVYTNSECQKDLMFGKVEENNKMLVFRDKNGELITEISLEDFYVYYIISLSLEKQLEEFFKKLNSNYKNLNKKELFENTEFYDDELITKAWINIKLLKIDKAMESLLDALLELKKEPNQIKEYEKKKGLSYVTDRLDIIKSICAYTHKYPNQPPEILKPYETGLNILKEWFKNHWEDFLIILNNIDLYGWNSGEYVKLRDFHKKVLNIYQYLYKNTNPDIAAIVKNYNIEIKETPDHYVKELIFYGKMLEIYTSLYMNENHIAIANSLYLFNSVYSDFKKASVISKQSLEKFYLETMGAVYHKLGDFHHNNPQHYICAIGQYEAALGKYGNDHPNIAIILQNMDAIYHKIADYYITTAANKCEAALDIYGYGPSGIIIILQNMGEIYYKLGSICNKNYDIAIECIEISEFIYNKALTMQLELPEENPYADNNIQHIETRLQQLNKLLEAVELNHGKRTYTFYDDCGYEPAAKRHASDYNTIDVSGMDSGYCSKSYL